MSAPPIAADASTWPFWAPSDLERVEAALDLAGVQAGDRVADLGCGDGQVLVAAARRGATVIGVESEPELAEQALAALAANHVGTGEVLVGDLFDVEVDADVFFTYLAPATLQRLLPRLAGRAGARLVTVDFAVPGLIADGADDTNHLYLLPGRPTGAAARPGWSCAGGLVIAPTDCQSLTVLDLHHPGGAVTARATGDLAGEVSILAGADCATAGEHVAIDLRWEPQDDETLLVGSVEVDGLDPFPVTAWFGDGEEGLWELSDEGTENLAAWLAEWDPGHGDHLVEATDGVS